MTSESVASTAGSPLPAPPPPANHRTSPITPPRLGSCFNCKQEGHWLKDCPLRRSPASPAADGARGEHPELRCLCGGLCVVRTSWTASNPGRQFYTCPIMPREDQCNFFKWCDEVIPGQLQGAYSPGKSQKLGLRSPVKRQQWNGVNSPRKPGLWHCDRPDPSAPMCSCGAGRCIILKMEKGEFFGRHYFGCPIKKGQGACNFFKWRKEEVEENDGLQPEGMVEVNEPKAEVVTAGVDQRKFVSRSEEMVPDVSIVPESPLPSCRDEFSPIKRLNRDEGTSAKPAPSPRICSKCGKQGHWFNEHGHCFKCDIAETVITAVSPFPSSIDHRLDHRLKHSGDGFSPMRRLSLETSSPIKVGARSDKCFKCGKVGHWTRDCSG